MTISWERATKHAAHRFKERGGAMNEYIDIVTESVQLHARECNWSDDEIATELAAHLVIVREVWAND